MSSPPHCAFDPDTRCVGYLLGYLLALWDKIQEVGKGSDSRQPPSKVWLPVITRQTSLAFGRMMEAVNIYRQKLQNRSKDDESYTGVYLWLFIAFERTVESLPEVPERLTGIQANNLYRGLYHGRRWLYLGKEKRKEWERFYGVAPETTTETDTSPEGQEAVQ